MILPDHEIRKLLESKDLVISPLANSEEQIRSAGVDLRLGNEFRLFKVSATPYIDIKNTPENYTELIKINDNKPFIIHPGEFVLGSIKEYIKMPSNLMGSVDGRSSLGRLGIVIHATSSSINPGWEGRFVLEITNIGKMPVALYPGFRVAKLTFHKLSSPPERSYAKRSDVKYQGQDGIEETKIHQESNKSY
jgi:dCTP deaminase